jgi:DNA uptake protein ComE-like DNA-binding protein
MKRTTTQIFLSLLLATALAACATASPSTTSSTSNNSSSGASTDSSNIARLNLNTVNGDELLTTIPGFSNRMVREFQEYRPYVSIQQFRREIGKYVGDAQVAEYENYVYVPIAINGSDSDTLQQIPGLDAIEAETLIASRPYASTDEFIAKLNGLVSAAELEIAKTYLGE